MAWNRATPAAAVWLLAVLAASDSAAAPPAFARVNFQPSAAPVPPGYLKDSGEPFGDRGGGFSFGWSVLNPWAFDRDSPLSPDQRYDTRINLQRGASEWSWEIAVPPGSYRARVVAGDADTFDAVYRIAVEGAVAVDGTPTSANRWIEGTAVVAVADGALTISNSPGGVRNRLCFLDLEGPCSPVEIVSETPGPRPTMAAGEAKPFEVWAVDADGEDLAYSWTVDGVPQDEEGPLFLYAPDPGDVGNRGIAVTVSDPCGAPAFHSWDLEVAPPGTFCLDLSSIGEEDGRVAGAGSTGGAAATVPRIGDNARNKSFRTILSFDTSAIPADAAIAEAGLYLRRKATSAAPPDPGFHSPRLALRSGPFNGNPALEGADFAAASDAADAGAFLIPPANGAGSESPLNAAGIAAINRAGRTQIRIAYGSQETDGDGVAEWIAFHGGEDPDPARRPTLRVCWQSGGVAVVDPSAVTRTAAQIREELADLRAVIAAKEKDYWEKGPDGVPGTADDRTVRLWKATRYAYGPQHFTYDGYGIYLHRLAAEYRAMAVAEGRPVDIGFVESIGRVAEDLAAAEARRSSDPVAVTHPGNGSTATAAGLNGAAAQVEAWIQARKAALGTSASSRDYHAVTAVDADLSKAEALIDWNSESFSARYYLAADIGFVPDGVPNTTAYDALLRSLAGADPAGFGWYKTTYTTADKPLVDSIGGRLEALLNAYADAVAANPRGLDATLAEYLIFQSNGSPLWDFEKFKDSVPDKFSPVLIKNTNHYPLSSRARSDPMLNRFWEKTADQISNEEYDRMNGWVKGYASRLDELWPAFRDLVIAPRDAARGIPGFQNSAWSDLRIFTYGGSTFEIHDLYRASDPAIRSLHDEINLLTFELSRVRTGVWGETVYQKYGLYQRFFDPDAAILAGEPARYRTAIQSADFEIIERFFPKDHDTDGDGEPDAWWGHGGQGALPDVFPPIVLPRDEGRLSSLGVTGPVVPPSNSTAPVLTRADAWEGVGGPPADPVLAALYAKAAEIHSEIGAINREISLLKSAYEYLLGESPPAIPVPSTWTLSAIPAPLPPPEMSPGSRLVAGNEGLMPGARLGSAYSRPVLPIPGAASYDLAAGALPPGLSLASDGTVEGTPTEAGPFSFVVSGRDAGGGPAGRTPYTMVVRP